jgi:hypothetical protein
MLLALAGLLLLGAVLVWPRDRGDRSSPPAAAPVEQAQPAPPPVAPEVTEGRYLALDSVAYVGPDVASAQLRALRRGERIEAIVSGGEAPAPEGWVRLQSGGFVTAESLAVAPPPALQTVLNQDAVLPTQTDLFSNPRLSGRAQRTLAAGQPLRLVGLVSNEVAEVRIGQELGYVAYAAFFAAPPPASPSNGDRPQQNGPATDPRATDPRAGERLPPMRPPPPILPRRDTPPAQEGNPVRRETPQAQPRQSAPVASGEAVVLGMGDLTRQPSNSTMQRYYPPRALRDGVGASVAFSCRINGNGRLADCAVYRETGRGAGFSDATIRLAEENFQVPQRTQDGRPTAGGRFNATIVWRAE